MSCSTWKCVYYIYCVVLILVWGLGQHLKGKKKIITGGKSTQKKGIESDKNGYLLPLLIRPGQMIPLDSRMPQDQIAK